MAKVYGIHVVELNRGVTPAAFEQFVVTRFLPALPFDKTPGVKASLLRADRGARLNEYVFLFEFDSVATRDRYFPEPQRVSEELLRLIAPLRELSEMWTALSTRTKTDYVVVAASGECGP